MATRGAVPFYHSVQVEEASDISLSMKMVSKGQNAAVPEEENTTDGGPSVQPVAAVLREDHQRQSVAAGVSIHLRTTSSLIFHQLTDATISDCFPD